MNPLRSNAAAAGRGVAWLAVVGLIVAAGCTGGAPTPFVIQGESTGTDEIPELVILQPTQDATVGKGDRFLIRWTDSDRDSNAMISFSLIDVDTNREILLVAGIDENDSIGPDSFSAGTSLVPVGRYTLRGTIDDMFNLPVNVFATTDAATPQRVVVTIAPSGSAPPTVPPSIYVVEPAFNQSVAQEDTLAVTVRPTVAPVVVPTPQNPDPDNPSYDPDSDITLYILLDTDENPGNDDPANPERDANGNLTRQDIIVLHEQPIVLGGFDEIDIPIEIDLETIPPRPNGEPYFIRATVDDSTNPRVHQYAVGTISVVELAEGTVDLFDIGRSKSGATFYGFNPAANLGSSISSVGDFDGDGIDDFVLVAQYGNPRNFGQVGEAYLIYGLDQVRFGNSIAINSISESVSGCIFEGTPVRRRPRNNVLMPGTPQTLGITDVSFIEDITGDGRPDILFGMPLVWGAFEAMDWDPGDETLASTTEQDVTVTIRDGLVTVEVGGTTTSDVTYRGVSDLTISTTTPNLPNGSGDLSWVANDAEETAWTLIKFEDVLDHIPDGLAQIQPNSILAFLEVRVFDTGGNGTVYESLTDFNEQTTYSTFAVGGGDPQPDVDFVQQLGGGTGGLGNLIGNLPEVVRVDVSSLIQALIDRNLGGSDDELRFLIAAGTSETAEDRTGIRSSEFTSNPDQRPKLDIDYTRDVGTGAIGCYLDDWVNNVTTNVDEDRPEDHYFYYGGMALMVSSQNRDNVGPVNPFRLENTSVVLELVGQESGWSLDAESENRLGGGLAAFADNTSALNADGSDARGSDDSEPGRIAGVRFVAGGFDFTDARLLNQPGRAGQFGRNVASIGDLNNDGLNEIIVSAPTNERYMQTLLDNYGTQSTHHSSTFYDGSIVVFPGANYNGFFYRDKSQPGMSTATIPTLDSSQFPPFGICSLSVERTYFAPRGPFQVYAEDMDDMLGGAQSARDFNQDGLDDILCGAPLNDKPNHTDTGAVYILYGRNVLGNFQLDLADDPIRRAPMLRIRGERDGDQLGWRQATGMDVNGDRIDDVFIASPRVDTGHVVRTACAGDFNKDGNIDDADLSEVSFNACLASVGTEVFSSDDCRVFDYDNDRDIDEDDRAVLECLSGGGTDCCSNLVDNGFVGVIFGGVFLDGDRVVSQLATSDLPGTVFYGFGVGHQAGMDVSSAGDFNQDGFGDLLIAAPGETRWDPNGRERLGVVYLVFGGTHLTNRTWSLAQVGSEDLPGIVFLSPYVKGRPNEAPPERVAFIGDINNDGFGDIAIGNPTADFIDLTFPQGPNAPSDDPTAGRRSNAGDVYIVYGNNFGRNRLSP